MTQPTNKSIEDVVEEIFKYLKCRVPFLSGRGILARILTSLVQQSKEEERERIKDIVIRELFPDKYPSLSMEDGKRLLETLCEKLSNPSKT